MTPREFIEAAGTAMCPEDLFGPGPADEVKRAYHSAALAIHPDGHPAAGQEEAHRAFIMLQEWYAVAQARITHGTYGLRIARALFTLHSRAGEHRAERLIAAGDVSDVYEGTSTWGGAECRSVLKINRIGRDADLMDEERRALKRLRADARAEALQHLFPEVLESVQLAAGRSATIFRRAPRPLTPLADILHAYHGGLDPRDWVWMWKRALAALGCAHHVGLVHGAVTPAHLLYDLADHGVVLVGWGASTQVGGAVTVISRPWRALYPSEVLDKRPAHSSTDLYMLARCILAASGGRPAPGPLARLLRGCLLKSPEHRLDDAWWLMQEIDGLLPALFGPKRFRPFTMPSKEPSHG